MLIFTAFASALATASVRVLMSLLREGSFNLEVDFQLAKGKFLVANATNARELVTPKRLQSRLYKSGL